MKNPIDYIEKLVKRLERRMLWNIFIIVLIIIGLLSWFNYREMRNNLSEISFSNRIANKVYCITANTKLYGNLTKEEEKLEVLKNEKFSCYKDMETCYKNIDFVWYDVIDFLSDYYKVEDLTITKSKKYNSKKNQLINAWWENNILKVYCLEVIITPIEEGKEND